MLPFGANYSTIIPGLSTQDRPPRIQNLEPAELGNPSTYVQFARTDSAFRNKLACTAENADEVYWMYKAELSGTLSRTLPQEMKQLDAETGTGNLVIRRLTDAGANSDDRSNINGYYQCFASNNQGNGYLTPSPLIRLIYAGKFPLSPLVIHLRCYSGMHRLGHLPYHRIPSIIIHA